MAPSAVAVAASPASSPPCLSGSISPALATLIPFRVCTALPAARRMVSVVSSFSLPSPTSTSRGMDFEAVMRESTSPFLPRNSFRLTACLRALARAVSSSLEGFRSSSASSRARASSFSVLGDFLA